MGLYILIAILICIVLYLTYLSCIKLNQLKEEEHKIKRNIARLKSEYDSGLETKEHNNMVLLNENSKLTRFKYGVEDLVNGMRTPEEIVNKIKNELLPKYR